MAGPGKGPDAPNMPAQVPVTAGEWEEVPINVIQVLPGFAVTHTKYM